MHLPTPIMTRLLFSIGTLLSRFTQAAGMEQDMGAERDYELLIFDDQNLVDCSEYTWPLPLS